MLSWVKAENLKFAEICNSVWSLVVRRFVQSHRWLLNQFYQNPLGHYLRPSVLKLFIAAALISNKTRRHHPNRCLLYTSRCV